jgi:hypothetical protein
MKNARTHVSEHSVTLNSALKQPGIDAAFRMPHQRAWRWC